MLPLAAHRLLQGDDDGVGDEKAPGRQTPAPLRPRGETVGLILGQQLLHGAELLAELPLEIAAVDALGRPQRQHDVLQIPVQRRDPLHLRQTQLSGDVGVQVPLIGEADAPQIGVGPRAEAGVFPQLPVFQVVAALEARPGKVGDLVLGIALLCQIVHRP